MPGTPHTLEFLPGPLSVGDEILTTWDTLRDGGMMLHILTPTDSCRDRLAAFYHWADYSSLAVAVAIALANRTDMRRIREWSDNEGAGAKFGQFERALIAATSRGKPAV